MSHGFTQSRSTRRTVLRTGAVGGALYFGRVVRGTPGTDRKSYGQRLFVDVRLSHVGYPEEILNWNDGPVPYTLDSGTRNLFLTEFASDSAISTFVDEEAVLRGRRFRPPPSRMYGGARADLLIDRTRSLTLEEEYEHPEVDVAFEGSHRGDSDTVRVTVSGRERTVQPETTQRITLPPREITFRRRSDELVEVEAENAEKTATVWKPGESETTTVRPTVVVENYGRVNVHEPPPGRDRRPADRGGR